MTSLQKAQAERDKLEDFDIFSDVGIRKTPWGVHQVYGIKWPSEEYKGIIGKYNKMVGKLWKNKENLDFYGVDKFGWNCVDIYVDNIRKVYSEELDSLINFAVTVQKTINKYYKIAFNNTMDNLRESEEFDTKNIGTNAKFYDNGLVRKLWEICSSIEKLPSRKELIDVEMS